MATPMQSPTRCRTVSQSASSRNARHIIRCCCHTRSTPVPLMARRRLLARRRMNIGRLLPFSAGSWNFTTTRRLAFISSILAQLPKCCHESTLKRDAPIDAPISALLSVIRGAEYQAVVPDNPGALRFLRVGCGIYPSVFNPVSGLCRLRQLFAPLIAVLNLRGL